MSLQCLTKEVRDEVDFLHADKHQSFLQVGIRTLGIKVSYKWYYHRWWAWSSILKVLKVTSLQYLYNISKKKLTIKLFNKNMINKFYTCNKIFIVPQLLFCSIVMQNIQMFYGGPVMFVVTCCLVVCWCFKYWKRELKINFSKFFSTNWQ